MKKLIVLLIVGLVLFGSCVEQKIIGSWRCNDFRQTWSFKANGVFEHPVLGAGNYKITGNELILNNSRGSASFNIDFSSRTNLTLTTKAGNFSGIWFASSYNLIKID